MKTRIENLPATRIALMHNVGPYGAPLQTLWKNFMVWAGAKNLINDDAVFYGISYDNPMHTPPEKCRYDAAIVVDENFKADANVQIATLPHEKVLCTSFDGNATEIGAAFAKLMAAAGGHGVQIDHQHPMIERYIASHMKSAKPDAFKCDIAVAIK